MKYKINLMFQEETPFTEKLVFFALNYLRYIIVITQLVVIGVFFYRFQIDQSIIDLKEAVDQKKEIVQIVLPLMQEAERIDGKSEKIQTILKKQQSFQSMNKYLLSVFPETITLSTMEIKESSIKLTGNAVNPVHLQSFFEFMKKDAQFNTVELENIKKNDEGYEFVMSLEGYKG